MNLWMCACMSHLTLFSSLEIYWMPLFFFIWLIHPVNGCYQFWYRSEVHEKMNCIRCQIYHETPQSIAEEDSNISTHKSGESAQETSDIGGFAEIAGCLQKLKSSEKQVGIIYILVITDTNSLLFCHFITVWRHFLFSGRDTSRRGFR